MANYETISIERRGAVAVLTIALKGLAWWITDSVGLLSDAMESFVNLASAMFALAMVTIAQRPADEDHPFGHHKAEYFAAGFEGTLLDAFAAATGAYRDDAADSLLGLGLFAARDLGLILSQLSVGQRRRFEVAVAVSVPSDILLLDEPTNHLAPELVEQLEKALLDYPGAVLTVTHDRRWREHTARAGQTRRIEVSSGGRVSVLPRQ